MAPEKIKVLKSALAILKREFTKTSCKKERVGSCLQCWVDISIIQLEAIINLVDEELWRPFSPYGKRDYKKS